MVLSSEKILEGRRFDVLLVKRDLSQIKFFLPTGRIEPQENEFNAGPREIKEKTGLDNLQLAADLGIVSRNGRDDSGNKYLKTIKYFLFLSTDEKDQLKFFTANGSR